MFLIVGFITIGCSDNYGSEEATNGDYIKITSVESGFVTEGEEISLTNNFDFRLASEDVGFI
jgi:hypothetical protein